MNITQQVFRNIFLGAWDGDTSPSSVNNSTYTNSQNVSLVGDGEYRVLQNVKGTTKISDLVSASSTDVLGAFEAKFKIGTTEDVNCLVVFTAEVGGNFKIFCHDLDNNVVYKLYQEVTPGDYFTDDRLIDGISYQEQSFDTLYFTDNYNEIRKLRCVIPAGSPDWFLTSAEIAATRKNPIGTIDLVSITAATGSLLSGSYQLAYQLVNPTTNKYSGFSLLTTPIHVYSSNTIDTLQTVTNAGPGLGTDKSIKVNITPTAEELDTYTHFRVAVVENINPEGADTQEIGLTKLEAISAYIDGGGTFLQNYIIKDNVQLDTTTLDDITIDLAAIKTVKSLAISNNRLVAGNVEYVNLEYDNGDPAISGGTILVKKTLVTTGDSFESDDFSSRYKGHFREEVYRFAISYFDGNGYYSYPKTLDLSSVTNNKITGGGIDMKFPERNDNGGVYTIMDSSSITQSLGLQLSDIDNHPTWAKGFIILRAKRKKNILFQTPMIQMSRHNGIGAVGKYPTTAREGSASPTDTSYPTAVPMGPSNTLVPRNLFYGFPTEIINTELSADYVSTGDDTIMKGEVANAKQTSTKFWMLFPDQNLYSSYNSTSVVSGEKIKVVDAIAPRLLFQKFDNEITYSSGDYLGTECAGMFFASQYNDYYHYVGAGKADISAYDYNIVGFKPFDNYNVGDTIAGENVFQFDKLTTSGISFGQTPIAHRSMIVKFNKAITPFEDSLTFAYTLQKVNSNNVSSGIFVSSTNVPRGNGFITSTAGLYGGGVGSHINAIPIVNVTQGLTDSRYGSPEDYHEFIFTGTKVVFTAGELSTVESGGSLPKTVDVWGGDCIVSMHTFKVSDTVYSVMNQEKISLLAGDTQTVNVRKWSKIWVNNNTDLATLCLPVPVNIAAQYVNVVLESEYHGSVRDIDVYDPITRYNNYTIYGANTKTTAKSPLTYNSSLGLFKQNDQKIFVPIDPTAPVITKFVSRLIYSNQKVYQSTIEGFNQFPVLNTYDLPETYGKLHKIRITNEAVYGLQTRGIAYIPVGEKVLELSNTSQLGVRTGDIFGKFIYLNTNAGTQHNRSVVSTGNSIFVFDNLNKAVYHVQGSSFEDITKGIISKGRNTFFTNDIPENDIVGSYDQYRKEYWLTNKDGGFCLVYNRDMNRWITNYTFSAGFGGGLSTNDKFYVIGNNAGNFATETMYTGNPTQFFGNYATSVFVEFYINPIMPTGKVFDDVLIASSDKLDTIDFTVERDAGLTNQTVTGITIDVTSRGEGNYRAKVLRDSNNARLRGLFAKAKVNWKTGASNPQVNLYAVDTKFRPSANLF